MKRSDPARYLKSSGIGFVLGVGAGWRAHTLGTAQEIAEWIENKFQTEISAAKATGRAIGASDLVEAWLAFARGPALPVTVGLAITVIVAFGLLKEFFGRATIDRIWPSYPDILDPKLERDNVARYRPLAAQTPFLERDGELSRLISFANDKGAQVAFMFLTGREGIGKTRLALEWLKKMKTARWDVGILDPSASTSEIRSSLLRNKTAILIDEPGRMENFWPILDTLLQQRKQVRIILANQISLRRPNAMDDDARKRIEKAQRETLQLHGLTDEALCQLAPDASDKQREDAQGCPLMVLIGPKDFAEIERRVALREENAEARNVGRVLALAALAGPVARTEVDRAFGMSVATSSLEPLFEHVDRATLDAMLPAFTPEVFADEIVLHHALDHPGNIQEFFERAAGLNAAAVEHRAASLWRRGGNDRQVKVVEALIATLDDAALERRDLARSRAGELESETARESRAADDGFYGLQPLTEAFNELADLADSRPFDSDIRHLEAKGAVNAIADYGAAGQFEALERWGGRLIALSERPEFRDDLDIQRQKARGAFKAITAYGSVGDFEALERWGARLTALYETPVFCDDRDIRLAEAAAAFNTITAYGKAGEFEGVERWGAQLIALCEMRSFRNDSNIRIFEAAAAANAMTFYGTDGELEEMERWGGRLIALSEMSALRNNRDIRRFQAMGAVNAIDGYGRADEFKSLKRWGDRLLALCDAPMFRDDPDIRIEEAKGAVNAIVNLGRAREFGALERWGSRLAALCKVPAFRDDPKFQIWEAQSAVNSMFHYGAAGQFDAVERWGDRLLALCERPAFRDNAEFVLQAAKGAVNAINHYGTARKFKELERWGTRLIALCELPAFRDDPKLRLVEAQGAVNAMTDYGEAGRFEALEFWGGRLTALREIPALRDNSEIRLEETKGAHVAITNYSKAGPVHGNARSSWFERLAHVARDFPFNPEIQNVATHLDLTYVQQKARGWRYGAPRQGLE